MVSSTLVTCLMMGLLAVAALVVGCSPSGLTRLPTCSMKVWGRRRRPASWPSGSAVRHVRRTVMCSTPTGRGMCRCRTRPGCLPSSCRYRSSSGFARMPAGRDAPCRAWSGRRWRSSWRGLAESIHAGERAGGRVRVCLRPPAGRGTVGGLLHPCPRTVDAQRARRPGSESHR